MTMMRRRAEAADAFGARVARETVEVDEDADLVVLDPRAAICWSGTCR